MIFQGNVRHGPTAAYYWAHFGGPDPACTGYAEELLAGDRSYHHTGGDPAWGYEGRGSEKVAIMLLARSLDCRWPYDCWRYFDGSRHPKRQLILKHYKQFTAEIVANFGDKWEITDKEILAWLAEKEAFQSQSNNK